MMIALMMRFVKPDVLASANSGYKLLKLDLKNESNLLSTSSVKVGFGVSTELKKMKTVQHNKMHQFQSNPRKLLIKLNEEILERSPLAVKLTHYLSALSPTQIVSAKPLHWKHDFHRFWKCLLKRNG